MTPVDANRVRTVLLGVNTERFHPCEVPEERSEIRQRYGLQQPYFFHVGDLVPRKNLELLIRLFAQLKQSRTISHQLVLAGKRNYGSEDIYDMPRRLGVADEVKFLGFVPEKDLPVLYTEAEALLYPSLYEGFGLPVLEAMACGVPVVCSQASSGEVLGQAGVGLSPLDEAGWLKAMGQLADDKSLGVELRRRGIQRAGDLSWQRTAESTLSVYKELGAS